MHRIARDDQPVPTQHRPRHADPDDTVVLEPIGDTVVLPAIRDHHASDDTIVLPRMGVAASSAPLPEQEAEPQPAGAADVGRSDARLGHALKWSYVLTTGGYAVIALLTFVLASILSPREFGVLAMALVWVALAMVLLQHGPTMAVIQQDDITEDHVNAAFWSTLIGAAGFCVVFAALAPLWAALNGLPELTPICWALTPMVMIQAFNVIPDAVLRRRMQMRGIAIRSLVANLAGGVAGIGCALAGLGVWSLVVQQITFPTLYGIMLWSIIDWRPRFAPIRKSFRDIRRTSLQTYGGSIGNYLSLRSDVLVMGLFFGPVVIGLYRFAARFAEMAVDLTASGLHQVSLPHLARHSQDKPALGRELGRLMHGTAVLACPVLGIVAGVAQPLVLFIGDQWGDAGGALRVLCLVSAVWMVGTLCGQALQAAQRAGIPALFTWITMVCAIAGIVFASLLSSGSDTTTKLMAAAWAMLATQVVTITAMGYVTYRVILKVSIWPTVMGALPGVLSGVAAAAGGAGVYAVVDGVLNKFLALAASGTAASVAAAIVLLTLDGEVRGRLARIAGRLRRTPAPAA
jgi:PST family polysaccharide transporter